MNYYTSHNEFDNVRNLIYNKYITPFNSKNNKNKNIGIELEFPIMNLYKMPIEMHVINGLMEYIMSGPYGFRIIRHDTDDNIAGLINDDGDVISFDNSFNNIEFAMAKAATVSIIAAKFYQYIELIQGYLRRNNYIVTGLGTNPYKEFITDSPVKIEIYTAIHDYLTKMQGSTYHNYSYFPPYLSSIQTHIDVSSTNLPDAINLYAKLDFVRAILFSNSLSFYDSGKDFEKYICFRDYLWEKSGFSYNPLNVGKNDIEFTSIEQIVNNYLDRSIFIKLRNKDYTSFTPVPIKDYFTDNCYDSIPEDIDTFFSFRTVELTFRGTIEIRSDCSQPLNEAFVPAAFNQGLSYKLSEAITLCNTFFSKNNIKHSNSQLRNFVISGKKIPDVKSIALTNFILQLIELSSKGLKQNTPEDAMYLIPLYSRVESLTCPALNTRKLLSQGASIEEIIIKYSSI